MNSKRTRLKIWSDARYLTPGQKPFFLFWPFWGGDDEDDVSPAKGRFARLKEELPSHVEMSALSEADVAVAPGEWLAGQQNEGIRALAAQATQQGKRTVIFYGGDSTETIDVPDALIWRTSLLASKRGKSEWAMPAMTEDFLQYSGGQVSFRPYPKIPTVGYCGYVAKTTSSKGARIVLNLGRWNIFKKKVWEVSRAAKDPSPLWRALLVSHLQRAKGVQTNFVLRSAFWAGCDLSSASQLQQARAAFVQNMLGSDYILCVRGAGNFSFRFYESLSCGRVPLWINTDCILPFENEIDWPKFVVKCDESHWFQCDKYLLQKHTQFQEETWHEQQLAVRSLWEKWLSPTGFTAQWCQRRAGLDLL